MSQRRAYDNSRRSAEADRTAERILDATIALLAASTAEISVASIARTAGVAAPTVYKHFPNRAAIFEAVQDRVDARFGRPATPRTIMELRDSIPRLHRFFAEHEPLVRAVVTTPALRPFWDATRKRREDGVRKAMHTVVAPLAKEEAKAMSAVVLRLIGVESWLEMKDHYRLDDATITAATVRALDAIIGDLERRAAGRKKEK